jgi:hypothetical protein
MDTNTLYLLGAVVAGIVAEFKFGLVRRVFPKKPTTAEAAQALAAKRVATIKAVPTNV